MNDRDRRMVYANGLSELYLPRYHALCDCLPDHWQPYYGVRSVAQQDALYARGRTIEPIGKTVTNAKGGESAHNYGCGTDWTVFNDGNAIWLPQHDPEWNTYRNACEKVGLLWGGEFKSLTDYYHNELELQVSWKEIRKALEASGMDGALALIAKVMVK